MHAHTQITCLSSYLSIDLSDGLSRKRDTEKRETEIHRSTLGAWLATDAPAKGSPVFGLCSQSFRSRDLN